MDRSGIPCGILMDQNGNLIIAGTINNTGTNKDFVFFGYDPNGRERFREIYNTNLDDIAVDLAINPAGWIFITGYTVGANYSQINTIRCIPDGSLEIVRNYFISGQNIYPSELHWTLVQMCISQVRHREQESAEKILLLSNIHSI
ncbi:MAG: hypothetical protein IPJ66_17295 [Bacteroidetes bacterium]|nr:hypothetical protein [Bacteroidota bacterium]